MSVDFHDRKVGYFNNDKIVENKIKEFKLMNKITDMYDINKLLLIK